MTGTSSLVTVDWSSIAWALLLSGLTLAAIAIKARYPAIAEKGPVARALAHALIGYFGLGMTLLGLHAAAFASFPVPGGAAWEGTVAVTGGLAATTIGACTLLEHLLCVAKLRRLRATAEVTARAD